MMKTILSTTKAPLLIALLVICSIAAPAQQATGKAAAILQLVNSQTYVFVAQTALPMGGRTRQLTGEYYQLTVTPSKLDAYLPYFGQAYTAPIDPSDAGIKFTDSSFDYKLSPRKKGGWDVFVKLKNAAGIQQLAMTISETGYASLQVTSTNRQPISFNGYIDAIKPSKK